MRARARIYIRNREGGRKKEEPRPWAPLAFQLPSSRERDSLRRLPFSSAFAFSSFSSSSSSSLEPRVHARPVN